MESYFAKCPSCQGAMDVTDLGPFTRVACPQCDHEVRVKTEMGNYQLKSRLAEGGMSMLFIAQDRTLGREVAVKVLNDDYSDVSSRVTQFEQEARLTASVSHPNVVKVYTVGESYGRYFIAMELVSGQSLEVLMEERGALPQNDVVEIALQVVDGLRAAHLAGLIHRDVKPGNILIDNSGAVKLVDFGLSLLTDEMEDAGGEIWATPYYVPPEALAHEEETFRSDIYSLGASLYHALSGEPPVEGLQPSTRILQEEKSNVKPLREVAPQLHPKVIALVEQAMAYSPKDRFASYEEFREELKTVSQILSGEDGAVSVNSRGRAERRRSTLKSGALVLMILILALLGGGYFYWKELDREEEHVGPVAPVIDTRLVPSGLSLGALPEDFRRVHEYFRQARASLQGRDYTSAERAFVGVAEEEGVPSAIRAWARFEAVVVAYLKGRPGDGQMHLEKLQVLLDTPELAESVMVSRLQQPREIMGGLALVPEEEFSNELKNPTKAFLHFAYCLKMWEQGQESRASQKLGAFLMAGPWPEAGWLDSYQEIAEGYLSDHRRLGSVVFDLQSSDADSLGLWMEQLEGMYGELRTRGRARFTVREWQVSLKRQMKSLERIQEEPAWSGILDSFLTHWRTGDFASARKTLSDFQPETGVSIRNKAMLLALVVQSEDLIRSLMSLKGEVVLQETVEIGGENFDGMVRGQSEGLVLKLVGEGKEVLKGWSEIGMSSLFSLHMQRLHEVKNPVERKRGLDQAVAFSLLGGLAGEVDWLFARVEDDPAPGGVGTWKELREKLGL